ncbi:MAG: aldolase catalytic domain-containing protein [Clostridia bacterium]|jgi:4-hydroxy 2-oxovalerate aldolase|nr:aldolase catalytic domain-containing protein [Clostridia bacterium]MBQ4396900.1 aldolase catalytic domain-containing protein [Clostridia bacterium]
MNRRGNIVSFRPDVRVLDATIRDGGLVNNFYFDDEFVRALYLANVKAGVDYMEFGYKASKELFSPDKFGKWKFCDEADIRSIVGDNNTDLKISVMADVGRTDFRRDIIPRSESVIDMVRVATYINTIPAALEMVEYCHELGYETTVNIMAISNASDVDIDGALELICRSHVDGIYLVDSYGSLYPEQIARLSEKYLSYGEAAGKFIGMHAHNNQQLAFANTIESMSLGVSYLDATVCSMGRGAGNCAMELLLGFFKNPKYNITPVLRFIEQYMLPLKASGVVWGYDVPYLLTGRLNRHPSSAIEFIRDGKTDYCDFYQELLDRD